MYNVQDLQAQYQRALALVETQSIPMAANKSLYVNRPVDTLPVSVTGTACSLKCAHCNGVYLEHMYSLDDLAHSQAPSALISGGCDPHGCVPIAPHLEALRSAGQGKRLNLHLGLVDKETAAAVGPLASVISFDVVGSRETTRRVYGLDVDLDTYIETLERLNQYTRVVPHITLGLDGGKIVGEPEAIQAVAACNVAAVVFIVLIPTANTAFAECNPPALDEVTALLMQARRLMPHKRLDLGCMRPHGAYRQYVDELAIRAGIDGIVNPAHSALQLARELDMRIIEGTECCALS